MVYGGGMFIGLIVLGLFVLLIVALVVGGIWLLSRGAGSREPNLQQQNGAQEDPLEILKRRYAAGEITREEYQAMREDLTA